MILFLYCFFFGFIYRREEESLLQKRNKKWIQRVIQSGKQLKKDQKYFLWLKEGKIEGGQAHLEINFITPISCIYKLFF